MRRSINDLKHAAEYVSTKLTGKKHVVDYNGAGYNVYIQNGNKPGLSIAYCGSLSECMAFIEGVGFLRG